MSCSRVSIILASGMCLGLSGYAIARDTVFNPALLEIDHPVSVDIRQFNHANRLPAGNYNVDIYINGRLFDRRDVTFVQDTPDADLHPCFMAVKEALKEFGVKVDALPGLDHVDDKTCVNPVPLIKDSSWALLADKLTLDINIPQIYLDTAARGYISPSRWDEGITALMVNYDFSGEHSLKSDYDEDDYYYLNLRNGFNMGAWRLRNYSTLNSYDGKADYHSISTYLQRDIAALRSQIMVGDTWTASDVFDSTQVRGVRLYTDNDMLPDSMNGFAPVVRGIAKSNATVTIKQNGYVIYQSAVPQGAFELRDLNTTSSGGDLDVTIKEADGSEQHFTQPYSSLAVLKRSGQTDVDISVGELRDQDNFTPNVFQAQVLHGLSFGGMTLYGGVQAAEDYAAAALGIGEDMGAFGAVSFDVTQAQAKFDDGDSEQGQSYRFLYSKRFEDTDTTFRLVGYRYSTEGFYSLNEWASRQGSDDDFWVTGNRRSRIEGTWTQSFGDGWGDMYLTLSRQQYWKTDQEERLVQLGYSNYWRQVSWNISWNYVDSATRASSDEYYDDDDNGSEQVFTLSISMPLTGWMNNSSVNYSLTQDDHHNSTHQVGLSSTAMADHNLSWGLQQSYSNGDSPYSGSASATYDGTYGSVNGNYAWSQDSQSLNYGASGGILIHSDGVTFSQELGDTVALVKAPGASGLSVVNDNGVTTDWRGYTVKTQLTPYDENRVAIDGDYFSKANVELENSSVSLVPTRGAVVKAEFITHVGYRVLFNVTLANGKPAPFGAMATMELESGMVTGIVGDNGDLYLSGLPTQGDFSLIWGTGDSAKCRVHYQFSEPKSVELIQATAICR